MRPGRVFLSGLFFGLISASYLAGQAPAAAPGSLRSVEGLSARFRVLGHASVYFLYQGKSIYVDPWGQQADYAALPKASVILITHEHGDHLDRQAIGKIRTENTVLIVTEKCNPAGLNALAMRNGEKKTVQGIEIEAVPAYNLANKRPDGQPFHPKGEGNGYVLTFDKKRVYVAGDTENIPEMASLKEITLAFLPMNLPYTMSPAMTSKAALSFQPRFLMLYHYGQASFQELKGLLQDKGITVLEP